jgi:hypothetical protein
MKLIIANQMFEPHVKALGLRWDDGDIHEDDLDAWHDAFNDLDFQDLFLCGDEDGKTFFLISDDDYELLENFLGQFDMIHGDNDVVTGLPYPEQLTFDCGPEDVEAFLKENCTLPKNKNKNDKRNEQKMDTIELTKQQARILNELADMLAPDYKGNELVLEGLAKSAQATQDEIQDTMESVFNQTFLIL